MAKSPCPSANELSACLVGTLPSAEAERVFDHVEGCLKCEVTLASLETAIQEDPLLSQLRRPRREDPYETEAECLSALVRVQSLVDRFLAGTRPSAGLSGPEAPRVGTLGESQLPEKLGEGGTR